VGRAQGSDARIVPSGDPCSRGFELLGVEECGLPRMLRHHNNVGWLVSGIGSETDRRLRTTPNDATLIRE